MIKRPPDVIAMSSGVRISSQKSSSSPSTVSKKLSKPSTYLSLISTMSMTSSSGTTCTPGAHLLKTIPNCQIGKPQPTLFSSMVIPIKPMNYQALLNEQVTSFQSTEIFVPKKMASLSLGSQVSQFSEKRTSMDPIPQKSSYQIFMLLITCSRGSKSYSSQVNSSSLSSSSLPRIPQSLNVSSQSYLLPS